MKYFQNYGSFSNLITESENASKDLKKLKDAILDIEDVEVEEYPEERKMIIKTDSVDTATRLHKFMLNSQREYIIKSVDPKDINDLVVILKTPEDIEKEEEEAEKKIKDAEAEKDAMMGLGDMGTGPDQKDIDVEI